MKTKKEKSAKVIAVSNLIAANKETKSLSGVIKLVGRFWSFGYREAFAFVGVNKLSDLKIETITKDLHQSMYIDNQAARYVKVAKKDEKGNFIMTEKNGKQCKVYDTTLKVVTTWTPRILFDVLLASKDAKEQSVQKVESKPIPSGKHTPKNTKKDKGAKAA